MSDSFQELYNLPADLVPAAKQVMKLSGRYVKIENNTKSFDWGGFRAAVGNFGGQNINVVTINNPPNTSPLFPGGLMGDIKISQVGNQTVLIFQNNGVFTISTFGFNPALGQLATLSQIASIAAVATTGQEVGIDVATSTADAANAGRIATHAAVQIANAAAVSTAASKVGIAGAAGIDGVDEIAGAATIAAINAIAVAGIAVSGANAGGVTGAVAAANPGQSASALANVTSVATIVAGLIQSGTQSIAVIAMVNWITTALKDVLGVAVDRAELTAQVQATFTDLKWAHERGFADFSSSSTGANSSWEYRALFATPTNDPAVFSSIVVTIMVEASIKEESSWWGMKITRTETFTTAITALKLSVNKNFTA